MQKVGEERKRQKQISESLFEYHEDKKYFNGLYQSYKTEVVECFVSSHKIYWSITETIDRGLGAIFNSWNPVGWIWMPIEAANYDKVMHAS